MQDQFFENAQTKHTTTWTECVARGAWISFWLKKQKLGHSKFYAEKECSYTFNFFNQNQLNLPLYGLLAGPEGVMISVLNKRMVKAGTYVRIE